MSRVYFISDTHFGHKNIKKFRNKPDGSEFDTFDDHDEYVLNNILSAVTKRDILWILGDVNFHDNLDVIEKIASNVQKLNIISGNHDFEKDHQPALRELLNIPNVAVRGLCKYNGYWLSHAPIHPDELRGKKNIHGHVHYQSIDDDRYINVCVESEWCNFKPIDFQNIKQEIKNDKAI